MTKTWQYVDGEQSHIIPNNTRRYTIVMWFNRDLYIQNESNTKLLVINAAYIEQFHPLQCTAMQVYKVLTYHHRYVLYVHVPCMFNVQLDDTFETCWHTVIRFSLNWRGGVGKKKCTNWSVPATCFCKPFKRQHSDFFWPTRIYVSTKLAMYTRPCSKGSSQGEVSHVRLSSCQLQCLNECQWYSSLIWPMAYSFLT